mmetsp:Transcript_40394/g.108193  ORF Transcript_40394/g.108193 Transcript_40394/m.108193 type:complete len:104 (-) Transcript_40394:91-402(-)
MAAVVTSAAVAALNVPRPPGQGHRLFRCGCGEVEIKLWGEPFLVNICHCSACIQVAQYCDKNGAGGGISAVAYTTDKPTAPRPSISWRTSNMRRARRISERSN